MELSTSDIITIVAVIISVLFGGGLLTYYLQERKRHKEKFLEERKRYKEEFLLRLQSILNQNGKIHRELTEKIDINWLEFNPNYVQHKFNELDDETPVKRIWNFRIETLIDNNEQAIHLIGANIGSIKNKDFKKACDDFTYHAQKFNDIWKIIRSDSILQSGYEPDGNLLGEKYPIELDKLLQREIDKH